MDNEKLFKLKFNELDALCQKKYPNLAKQGFDAMRKFARSIDKENGQTLLSLIEARNTHAHNQRALFAFNKSSIDFIDGLIIAIKHNTPTNYINSDVELLKRKNIEKMNNMMKIIESKLRILSNNAKQDLLNRFRGYIGQERRARTETEARNIYSQFNDLFRNINGTQEMKAVHNKKKQNYSNNLEKKKQQMYKMLDSEYYRALSEANNLNVFKRIKAKKQLQNMLMSLKKRIDASSNFDDLEDVMDDAEDFGDDILDEFDY